MASIKRYFDKNNVYTSFSIRVYRGTDENGKQLKPFIKTISIPPNATAKQIQKLEQSESQKFERECREGLVAPERIRFRNFVSLFLETKQVAGTEQSTLARYEDMLENRLLPAFGHLWLTEITGVQMDRFYAELSKPGANKKTGGALSAKTILEYHRLLSSIFALARKQHLIQSNPAEEATPPRVVRKEPNYFQPKDLPKIKAAFDTQNIKWRTLGYLFMLFGDRRGEYVGIKRQCIDFDRHQIFLSGCVLYHPRQGVYAKEYPKNHKARYIPLPTFVEALLREYLAWLDCEKEKWGDQWIATDYIFTGEHGGMMNPDIITKQFARISELQQKIDPTFPHLNPHAFRHTVVSTLISEGVDSKTAADFIGDDLATVNRFYAHSVTDSSWKAVSAMVAVMGMTQ